MIMMDDRKTRIVIPVHPGKDIKPQLIRAIIKEAGLSRIDFFKLLNKT
ncbi:MAG: type II toxin-antitoxin system HicA family toxin [Candidatus Bathyarchaeota archaeon]|nr:type II toxin-antitoxin system HicA family toxin [Candidatus Bathyarchaeum tardum]